MKQAELLEKLVKLNNEIASMGDNGFRKIEYMSGKRGKVIVSVDGEPTLQEMTRDDLIEIVLNVTNVN